jgi:DNA helicase-2/ATP-dependent DNA helicase PcrA
VVLVGKTTLSRRRPGYFRPLSPKGGYGNNSGPRTDRRLIEGDLIAKSVLAGGSSYARGERVFHQKFGYGRITAIEGNKLTVDFEKAGQKRVLDSFVARP